MNQAPTLRERVSQISFGTFIITIAIMLTSFILYSMKKAQIAEEHVINELQVKIPDQINQFLPSFLLPEQRNGIDLLLERIKKTENLTDAKIIQSMKDMDSSFSECILSPREITSCSTPDQNYTAVIAPLVESGLHFGYLFKAKRNVSPGSLREVLKVAGLILGILGLVFSGVYIFISRLLSKTLPKALDNLVSYIEADLNGTKAENISLPFKELVDLKTKITEVLERYNSSRDQAIIGQLTSGIMHDIKTPLQSMVAATYLVEEQDPGSAKRLSRLENAHLMNQMNLPLICKIIETTLDGSRTIKVEKQETDILKTIQQSLAPALEMAIARKVELEQRFQSNSPTLHDPVQMTRVVQNLVKNAIEAAAENSVKKIIRISTQTLPIGTLFCVEDSGPGFTSHPDQIFKAFRTTKLRGTGLGLVITKKIVEAHGGNITARRSIDLGGAMLEVLIPANEKRYANETSI